MSMLIPYCLAKPLLQKLRTDKIRACFSRKTSLQQPLVGIVHTYSFNILDKMIYLAPATIFPCEMDIENDPLLPMHSDCSATGTGNFL